MDVDDNHRPGVGESCTGGEGSNTGDDFNDDDMITHIASTLKFKFFALIVNITDVYTII